MQRVLDESLASASKLTRSLFASRPWSATQVIRFINAIRQITVATVAPTGDPHAATTLCACLDGTIYFTASGGSALLGHLRRNPKIAFTVTHEDHAIIGRGVATLAGRSLERPELIGRLATAAETGRFTPDGWDGYLYSVNADRLFAS